MKTTRRHGLGTGRPRTGHRAAALLLAVLAPALAVAAGDAGGASQVQGPIQLAWAARHDALIGSVDDPIAMARGGGRVFLTGTTDPVVASDVLTVAFDAKGHEVLWTATYDGDGRIDQGRAVDVDPAASVVFVTGSSTLENPGPLGGDTPDYVTLAYDAATGVELWTARYDHSGGWDDPAGLVVSPGGSVVYVTGESYGGTATSYNVATVAYDAVTGNELWVARYDGPEPQSSERGAAIDVGPDGTRVFITARGGAGAEDFLTLAYDARDGALLWSSHYDGPDGGSDQPSRIVVAPDGNSVFVIGRSRREDLGYDLATVGYDTRLGTELWARRHPADLLQTTRYGGLGVALGGQAVVVTSDTLSSGNGTDALTVAYEATTGLPLWRAVYAAPNGFAAHTDALVVDPTGAHVVVAGYVEAPAGEPFVDTLAVCYDAATGLELWSTTAQDPPGRIDRARDVAVSPDGARVLVASVSQGAGGSDDFALSVQDLRDGALIASARHDELASGHDGAIDVALTPDGAIVLATGGVSSGSQTEDETIALDAATGRLLWTARFADELPTWANGIALAVSPDGRTTYVAGGEGGGWAGDGVSHLLALDTAGGTELWHERHNTPDLHSTLGVAASPDGGSVFLGIRDGPVGGGRYLVLAFDAATAEQLWESSYVGPVGPAEFPYGMVLGPDGATVFVTGESLAADGKPDAATVAWDAATGEQLWVARYDAGLDDKGHAVAASPDAQRVFVAGTSRPLTEPQDTDFLTVAYDAVTGAELWTASYDGPWFSPWPSYDDDRATEVVVSLDGSVVFVAGTSYDVDAVNDIAVVAYDADTGEELWVARYGGPHGEQESVADIALGRDGETVVVCGTQTDLLVQSYPNLRLLTLAFDATNGGLRWSARYAAPSTRSYNSMGGLATDTITGAVFVAGGTGTVDTQDDFTVLAYTPDP